MKTISFLLCAVALHAGQSANFDTIISGSDHPLGTYTIPSSLSPVTSFREEFRVKLFGLNDNTITSYQYVFQTGVCNLMRWDSGSGLLLDCYRGSGAGGGSIPTNIDAPGGLLKSGSVDLEILINRVPTINKVYVDIWDLDQGKKVVETSIDIDTSGVDITGPKNVGAANGSPSSCRCEIAWARFWSTNSAYGTSAQPPANDVPGTPTGLVANWKFEGNGNDSGPNGMTISASGGRTWGYVTTPVPSPLVTTTGVSNPDGTFSLGAAATFFEDVIPTPSYQWFQSGGPIKVLIDNRKSANATARGMTTGSYEFRMVMSYNGQTFSYIVPKPFTATDANGTPFAPTNLITYPTVVLKLPGFSLAGVTQAVVTTTKANGQSFTTRCATSSCTVAYDPRMSLARAKVSYRNGSDVQIRSSEIPLVYGSKKSYTLGSTTPSGQDHGMFAYAGPMSPHSLEYLTQAVDSNGTPRIKYWIGVDKWHSPTIVNDLHTLNPNTKVLFYSDFSMRGYASDAPQGTIAHVIDYAHSRALDPAMFFVKVNVDYNYSNNSWENGAGKSCDGYNMFGAYRRGGSNQPLNSVLLYDGSYTDVSYNAFTDSTDSCWTANDAIAVTNTIMTIEDMPYDRWVVHMNTNRSGGAVTYYYSTGAGTWAALTPASDTTSGLSASGSMIFTPPSNWSRVSYNGRVSGWAIKAVVTGSPSQTPVIDSLRNDTFHGWNGTSVTDFRGWSPTASGRVNIGTELEYNPTPPSTATAHFQHQGWTGGGWSYQYKQVDHTLKNPNDSSEWLLRSYYTHVFNDYRSDQAWDGSMFDDAANNPCNHGCVEAGGNWDGVVSAGHAIAYDPPNYFVDQGNNMSALSTIFPGLIAGANNPIWASVQYASLGIDEGAFVYYPQITSESIPMARYGNTDASKKEPHTGQTDDFTYKDIRPVSEGGNNANGSLGVFQWVNTLYEGNKNTTHVTRLTVEGFPCPISNQWAYRDMADRDPMLSLGLDAIGRSVNSIFIYNTSGPFSYSDMDDVDVFDASEGKITGSISAGSSTISCNCAGLPSGSYTVQIYGSDTKREDIDVTKVSDTQLSSSQALHFSWSGGERIRRIRHSYLSVESPSYKDVHRYHLYFPAMHIDLGTPAESGDFMWKNPYQVCDSANDEGDNCMWAVDGLSFPTYLVGSYYGGRVYKREFSNAIVLVRSHGPCMTGYGYRKSTDLLPSLPSGTYYRLHADGTTDDDPVTEVKLGLGEAAILMKARVY